MNTTIFKELVITIGVLLVVIIGLLVFRPTRPVPDPAAERRARALQHELDSTVQQNKLLLVIQDTLVDQSNAFADQWQQQQQKTLQYKQLYHETLEKYSRLRRYDSLSPADIARYLSDSLP